MTDTLNNLITYFEPMRITEEDRKARIELAEDILDAMLFFFSAYEVFLEKGGNKYDRDYFANMVYEKLEDTTLKHTGIDSYLQDQLKTLSNEIVDTTINRLDRLNAHNHQSFQISQEEPYPLDGSSPEMGNEEFETVDSVSYWLSERRAFFIAVDTANEILNYTDYTVAIEEGKTHKQWLTMKDEKVRISHADIDGQTIGINDLFVVGSSVMKFPKDMEYSPSLDEVIRCRCSIRYF